MVARHAPPFAREKSDCTKDLPKQIINHTVPLSNSKSFGYGSKPSTIISVDETSFTS